MGQNTIFFGICTFMVIVAAIVVAYRDSNNPKDIDFDLINQCDEWESLIDSGTNISYLYEKCIKASRLQTKRLGVTQHQASFVGMIAVRRPELLLNLPEELVNSTEIFWEPDSQPGELRRTSFNIFHIIALRPRTVISPGLKRLFQKYRYLLSQKDARGQTPFFLAREPTSHSDTGAFVELFYEFSKPL